MVDAVRRCWSSLFGARTVYYRAKRGFGQADMDIAVVVQRQVQSTRAGVMFTIDPASGAETEIEGRTYGDDLGGIRVQVIDNFGWERCRGDGPHDDHDDCN